MSWIIIGDERYASFACNTGDVAFGPLHSSFSDSGNARKELEEFAKTLDEDPRKLEEVGKLRDKFFDWKRNRRNAESPSEDARRTLL